MNTAEILSHIQGNGGFDNFRKWNVKEIATWVRNYYNCSRYVANKVAEEIK